MHGRKQCSQCTGLTNPSLCEGGVFDSDSIGSWSDWQGNLNAPVMLIGQDWGDVAWFVREKGRPTHTSRTNTTLLKLFDSIGLDIKLPKDTIRPGSLFFTNAILYLKQGGAQAKGKGGMVSKLRSAFPAAHDRPRSAEGCHLPR